MATTTKDKSTGQRAAVSGLDLYYETFGAGSPLVLLHGGLGGIDAAHQPLISALARSRQVIAVELEAHGHTPVRDHPLSFEQMADDVAELVRQVGAAQADVAGYSLGGGVGWQMAIRHPDVVRKVVAISAPVRRQGWYPEVLEGMAAINADMMRATPIYQYYAQVAPRPEDWPLLIGKVRELLGKEYDWSEQVRTMQAPALIIVGDADGVKTAHAVEMFALRGGGQMDGFSRGRPESQLAILPGTGHLDILMPTERMVSLITPFLDAPVQGK